jgi:DNA helicase II / ATP-dependent DNA helicase PcrA
MKDWSGYQEAIFKEVEQGTGSLTIEAVAGSGKTTTIVEAINRVPGDRSIAFLAFNKSIAETLRTKITASNAKCMTLHSAGFNAWRRSLEFDAMNLDVDSGKTRGIVEDESGILSPSEREDWNGTLTRLVSIAKNAGMGTGPWPGLLANEDENWMELVDRYGLEPEDVEDRLDIVRKVLAKSLDLSREVIDYDDMLWVPILMGTSFEKQDVIFVDEAQDLSAIQVEMVSRMVRIREAGDEFAATRIIAIGDSKQAIYGFRGAMSDSMEKIARRFHAEKLPLSVTYRCGRKIVEHVQRIVPHIEWWEGAGEGEVKYLDRWNHQTFNLGDAILCRVNCPLAGLALHLIKNKIPARVLGRDIGQGLVKLVESQKARTVGELLTRLEQYRERQATRLGKAKGGKAKLAALDDRIETIQVFAEERELTDLVSKLTWEISQLFGKDGQANESCVTLSTVHKAKGLEWDRVFILDADKFMPGPWATQDWEREQEENLMYVAETRGKRELVYISTS